MSELSHTPNHKLPEPNQLAPKPAPDRRSFLQTSTTLIGAGVASMAWGGNLLGCTHNSVDVGSKLDGTFSLPELPYAYDALEPVIDQETMTIHHTKHHQAYITKLNEAVAVHPDLAGKSLADLLTGINQLPESARTAIRNHGGGHYNHSLFWQTMRPSQEQNTPTGNLAQQIESTFGSFETFREAFAKNAGDQFGSGWSWLVLNNGKLELVKTANQDCPLMDGKRPVLGIDVWEHAYYLKYQNRRADYVKAWWDVVNWDQVAKNLRG